MSADSLAYEFTACRMQVHHECPVRFDIREDGREVPVACTCACHQSQEVSQ